MGQSTQCVHHGIGVSVGDRCIGFHNRVRSRGIIYGFFDTLHVVVVGSIDHKVVLKYEGNVWDVELGFQLRERRME